MIQQKGLWLVLQLFINVSRSIAVGEISVILSFWGFGLGRPMIPRCIKLHVLFPNGPYRYLFYCSLLLSILECGHGHLWYSSRTISSLTLQDFLRALLVVCQSLPENSCWSDRQIWLIRHLLDHIVKFLFTNTSHQSQSSTCSCGTALLVQEEWFFIWMK